MITFEPRCTGRATEMISTIARGVQIPSLNAGWSRRTEDRQLRQMQDVFARHGGMLSGDSAARAMRHRSSQPISMIAKWIVARELVHLVLSSGYLLPMFQFDPLELELRPGVREAVLALRDGFDDWDICLWFASANASLGGAIPVDRVGDDPHAVVRAARADRGFFAGTRQLSTSTRVSNT